MTYVICIDGLKLITVAGSYCFFPVLFFVTNVSRYLLNSYSSSVS